MRGRLFFGGSTRTKGERAMRDWAHVDVACLDLVY
jgi:hypothetical protein